MLRLNQTRYGVRYGNCMAACVACIIEKEVWQLPDFPGGQADKVQDYLQSIGLDYLEFKVVTGTIFSLPDTLMIGTGLSPRGAWNHAVIVDRNADLVWDPHPSRAGIKNLKTIGFVMYPEKQKELD